MKRRIFVAIGASEDLRRDVLDFAKRFSNLPVRWLEGKNLHVTLIPPWYEDNVGGVIKKLGESKFNIRPFDIEFQHVTYGPNSRSSRLIWAEGETPKELFELKNELSLKLSIREENRPFRTHLTLARFPSEQFPAFPVKEINEAVSWPLHVSSFILMESHLMKTGADYDVLHEFSL